MIPHTLVSSRLETIEGTHIFCIFCTLSNWMLSMSFIGTDINVMATKLCMIGSVE